MNTLIITADGSHSIASDTFNETYHSVNGALNESRHVFIEAGLNYLIGQGRKDISILEIGFGTGLNAYLTLIEAENQNLKIQYCGIDAYPIQSNIWKQLNYPEILNYSPELFYQLHAQLPSTHFKVITPNFSFSKIIAKIEAIDISDSYDLIYFDAFAPTTQPELWDESVLQKLYNSLNSGGILVTYCAKGSFKRALKSVGFMDERLPGAAGKREMTRAIRI